MIQTFAYLARDSEAVADRFYQSTEETFALLARSPGLGARYDQDTPGISDLRCFPVHRFRKYLVFYRQTDDGIEVVRVLHGARDLRGHLIEGLGLEDEAGG